MKGKLLILSLSLLLISPFAFAGSISPLSCIITQSTKQLSLRVQFNGNASETPVNWNYPWNIMLYNSTGQVVASTQLISSSGYKTGLTGYLQAYLPASAAVSYGTKYTLIANNVQVTIANSVQTFNLQTTCALQ